MRLTLGWGASDRGEKRASEDDDLVPVKKQVVEEDVLPEESDEVMTKSDVDLSDVEAQIQELVMQLQHPPFTHRDLKLDELMRALFMNHVDTENIDAGNLLQWTEIEPQTISELSAGEVMALIQASRTEMTTLLDEAVFRKSMRPALGQAEVDFGHETSCQVSKAKLRVAILELFLEAHLQLPWSIESVKIDCDVWYQQLETIITPLNNRQPDFLALKKAFHGSVKEKDSNLVVVDIFDIQRIPEIGRFEDVSKQDTCLFFHETHRENLAPILQHGLLVTKTSGWASSLFFWNDANRMATDWQYRLLHGSNMHRTDTQSKDKYLLVAEVNLGNVTIEDINGNRIQRPRIAVPRSVKKHRKLQDGTYLPYGQGRAFDISEQERIVLRYLVKYQNK